MGSLPTETRPRSVPWPWNCRDICLLSTVSCDESRPLFWQVESCPLPQTGSAVLYFEAHENGFYTCRPESTKETFLKRLWIPVSSRGARHGAVARTAADTSYLEQVMGFHRQRIGHPAWNEIGLVRLYHGMGLKVV